ncbi:hypothetical protein CIB84_013808 [Bambusicola thoracicus]|uniref:Uncharacterized protein n=1 Tax=Bambusicola thoracicus TaxID=9083 RepID=A0A2P4SEB7_BAMTH|nr:hypothetical protein CIB84_013808 [Bambusicola thoracicus]
MELLLGELREVSLQGSLGSSTSRSCPTTSTSDVEAAAEGNGMEAPGGTVALQSSGAAGEEGVAADEAVAGGALEMDEFLQGLGAADEDTCSASPEPMFSMDLDTEWEKGHLLKGERLRGREDSLLPYPWLPGLPRQWYPSPACMLFLGV